MNQNITLDEIKVIRIDIQQALDELATKHNLSKLSLGNIRYGTTSFTSKIEAERTITGTNNPATKQEKTASTLDLMCRLIGLDTSNITKTFVVNGHPTRIVEIKPKRPVYPIIVQVVGKEAAYKLSVKQLLGCKTV